MEHTTRFNFHKAGIDAAIDVGVKHIYYTSLAYNGEPSACPVMWAHSDTEKYLQERGKTAQIKYTLIREGLYNEAFLHNCGLLDIGKALEDPEQGRDIIIRGSGDALVAYASIADLAEATGRIIAHEGPDYDNRLLLLSGPKGYSIKDVAGIISSTLSLHPPLRTKSVSTEEYVNYHLANSQLSLAWMIYPPRSDQKTFLENMAGAARAEENGETAVTSELLEEILGRKPTSMEETVPTILNMRKGKI
jgi:nucleoside-diphosphate-sugar epimerase